jgi:tetratricopeptide (TPR) repeat protein
MGMTFWTGAVAELSGADADTGRSLEALEERDFVRSQDESTVAAEREWAFKHALLRDVAYGRLPKGRRATLHVRFVDWVTAQSSAEDEFVEIVAYHLEQACKLGREVGRSEVPPPVERAVAALMRAAEKAERREGIREADRYYARALELAGEDETEQTLELRLGRAGTLNMLGDLQQADEYLTRVADGAPEADRPDFRARALIGRANIAAKQGRGAEASLHVTEAESIAGQLEDRSLQVRAIYMAAYVRWWFEDAGEASVEALKRGLAIAEELEDHALQIEGHVWLVILLYNVGDLAGAQAQLVPYSALAGEVGGLRDQARATFQLGLVKYHLGEIEEAELLGLQALEWLDRTGDRFYQLQNMRALALCAVARSEFQLAEERLRDAVPLALEIGGVQIVEIYRCLIDVLIRQSRLSDARELAVFASRNVPKEDVYARAAGLLIEASVRTAEGRREPAEESFVEALRLLEEQRLPLDLGEARLAFGRALRRLGDDARAEVELEQAREPLVRMGARGLVDDIDRELATMREGAGLAGPLASP